MYAVMKRKLYYVANAYVQVAHCEILEKKKKSKGILFAKTVKAR